MTLNHAKQLIHFNIDIKENNEDSQFDRNIYLYKFTFDAKETYIQIKNQSRG